MKIKNWMGAIDIEIAPYVESRMDQGDYGLGEIETLRATQHKIAATLGRLCEILHTNGALSEREIFYIVNDSADTYAGE